MLTNAVCGSVKLVSWMTSASGVLSAEMFTSQSVATVVYAADAITRFVTSEI